MVTMQAQGRDRSGSGSGFWLQGMTPWQCRPALYLLFTCLVCKEPQDAGVGVLQRAPQWAPTFLLLLLLQEQAVGDPGFFEHLQTPVWHTQMANREAGSGDEHHPSSLGTGNCNSKHTQPSPLCTVFCPLKGPVAPSKPRPVSQTPGAVAETAQGSSMVPSCLRAPTPAAGHRLVKRGAGRWFHASQTGRVLTAPPCRVNGVGVAPQHLRVGLGKPGRGGKPSLAQVPFPPREVCGSAGTAASSVDGPREGRLRPALPAWPAARLCSTGWCHCLGQALLGVWGT